MDDGHSRSKEWIKGTEWAIKDLVEESKTRSKSSLYKK